ncbi:HEPN domain-containing protein [Mesorhizobium sp. CA7]|uniref:HEPN domain-containing protein n=1 Tax=Mesorhizobium sp. CA7 TaxID=588501 RepID=UPI001CCB8E8D|nr:HEPN domain-containing protein [Mesorhizobium sp. CA7]MBZ9815750.1 HEPN domain-containing protein [Mesorhizobium sp. CA7]
MAADKPPVQSLADLHAELALIDEEMRKAGVKFTGRDIRGWQTFSSRRGLGLRMPSPIRNPSPDDLSYDALSAHIFAWFDRRYGKKLNIVYAPSAGVIDIDGDLFSLSVSIIYGQVNVEVNPQRLTFKYSSLVKDRFPKMNLLQSLKDLTQAYAESIPPALYVDLVKQYGLIVTTYNEMMAHHSVPLVAEASVDIDAGAAALMDGISFGHARWCFHQAAEKSVKALLQHEGVSYSRRGHDLKELIELSTKLAGKVRDSTIATATCSSKARYGEVVTSVSEAILSYRSALTIIDAALKKMPGKRLFRGIVVYPGPFPDSEFDPKIDGLP